MMCARSLEWTGAPEEVGELWQLTRERDHRRAVVWTHPLGLELRIYQAEMFLFSQVFRTLDALISKASAKYRDYGQQGWARASLLRPDVP